MRYVALEYLKRRAAEEIQKRRCAKSKKVADIHRAMADTDYERLRGAQPSADNPVPDLSRTIPMSRDCVAFNDPTERLFPNDFKDIARYILIST